jgi:prepilin-type N-terminal cleavage/methylation domain-containing protein
MMTLVNKNSKVAHRRHGFTLVELLVVITIIVVLAALSFSGYKFAMTKVQMAKTMGNLRQLGVATISYAADHNGFVPIGDAGASGGGRGLIWINQIAPNLGNPELEDQQLNQGQDGMDQWSYLLTKYKSAPFVCGALVGTELAMAKSKTVDAIGGISCNANPWLPANGNANASWNVGTGAFKAPPQLNAITYASSRCMYASGYDWHLFGTSGVRAYNRFGKNKAAMVFWDGSSRIVNKAEYDRAIERPDKH